MESERGSFFMNIGVVGGGSVGLLISSYLSLYHRVRVYVRRNEQAHLLRNEGIVEEKSRENFSVESLLVENMKEEELIIICVKQHQIEDIMPMINQTNSQTPLLFLPNGMSHTNYLSHLTQPVYVGINSHGSLREKDNLFSHTGKGEIAYAQFNASEEGDYWLRNHLNNISFPVRFCSSWKILLKEKLIVNAVINPLTALFNVKNGVILSNKYLYDIAEKLCFEAAESLNLDFEENWHRVQTIDKKTSENISSMLKDLMENRPTENEAISGYIITESTTELPYTTFVYKAIQALEYKNS